VFQSAAEVISLSVCGTEYRSGGCFIFRPLQNVDRSSGPPN
jgi:hypothetical protein